MVQLSKFERELLAVLYKVPAAQKTPEGVYGVLSKRLVFGNGAKCL